jgi:hypothetical protein
MALVLGRLQVFPARGYDDELLASMSSCLLASSVWMHVTGSLSPIPHGRKRGWGAEDVRSHSRSLSPTVAPQMPEEEDDDEAVMYTSTWRWARRRVDEGDAQNVLEDDEDGDVGAVEDMDARQRDGEGEGKRLESRTRRW